MGLHLILKGGLFLQRMPLDDIAIARVLHLLAVIHWIGRVSLATAVILPAIARFSEPSRRIAIFEETEGRFSFQAKTSVALAASADSI